MYWTQSGMYFKCASTEFFYWSRRCAALLYLQHYSFYRFTFLQHCLQLIVLILNHT